MQTRAVRAISFLVALAAVGGAHACGTQVTGGDSESHFLATCGSRCGDGLACICGVCTRACDDTGVCGALSRRAECAAPNLPVCGGVRVCDVACLADDACKIVGPSHVCILGRCRDTLVPVEAGAGGASGIQSEADITGAGSKATGGAKNAAPPGGGGAVSVEHPDAGGPCDSGSKTYPQGPTSGGSGGDIELVVVQSDVDFGDSPPTTGEGPTRYRAIGYDLDGACDTKCAVGRDSNVIDGPGAVDNAYGQIVQSVRNLLTNFSSEIYSAQIRKGVRTLMIHVTGYNGGANDEQVRVEVMHTARFNAFSSNAAPTWNGTDVFPVDENSFTDRDVRKPRAVDPNAYVTNGKLVAALGEMTFPDLVGFSDVYDSRMELPMHAAVLTCDVASTDTGSWGFTLRTCTLAGRVIADDLVHQLWHLPDPVDLQNPRPLCTDSTSYPALKRTICSLVDIQSTGTVSGPVPPCDALSLGVNFNTLPARLGDLFNDQPSSARCAAGVDPSNDSCDQ